MNVQWLQARHFALRGCAQTLFDAQRCRSSAEIPTCVFAQAIQLEIRMGNIPQFSVKGEAGKERHAPHVRDQHVCIARHPGSSFKITREVPPMFQPCRALQVIQLWTHPKPGPAETQPQQTTPYALDGLFQFALSPLGNMKAWETNRMISKAVKLRIMLQARQADGREVSSL